MNQILAIILSWQFIFLSLAVALITYVIRTITDYVLLDNPRFPGTRNSRAWRVVILPLLPIILGGIFAVVSYRYAYTYPDGVNTKNAQFIFCIAAGGLSSVMFRMIRGLLLNNIDPTGTNTYPPYVPPVVTSVIPSYISSTTQNTDNGHGIDSSTAPIISPTTNSTTVVMQKDSTTPPATSSPTIPAIIVTTTPATPVDPKTTMPAPIVTQATILTTTPIIQAIPVATGILATSTTTTATINPTVPAIIISTPPMSRKK